MSTRNVLNGARMKKRNAEMLKALCGKLLSLCFSSVFFSSHAVIKVPQWEAREWGKNVSFVLYETIILNVITTTATMSKKGIAEEKWWNRCWMSTWVESLFSKCDISCERKTRWRLKHMRKLYKIVQWQFRQNQISVLRNYILLVVTVHPIMLSTNIVVEKRITTKKREKEINRLEVFTDQNVFILHWSHFPFRPW